MLDTAARSPTPQDTEDPPDTRQVDDTESPDHRHESVVLAIGMLMAQRRCSRFEAAAALAAIASRVGRPVADVADRLVQRYDPPTPRDPEESAGGEGR